MNEDVDSLKLKTKCHEMNEWNLYKWPWNKGNYAGKSNRIWITVSKGMWKLNVTPIYRRQLTDSSPIDYRLYRPIHQQATDRETTDTRPTYRPILGRQSPDISVDTDRYSNDVSADTRPTYRSIVGRQCRSTVPKVRMIPFLIAVAKILEKEFFFQLRALVRRQSRTQSPQAFWSAGATPGETLG